MRTLAKKLTASVLGPMKSLGFLGRKPVTVGLEPRPAADNYRGFHVNDWDKCIGCSTCQKICDNAAISMVHIPVLPEDAAQGIRAERPAIDYGRCCWCGLCVDVCPTGSLALSREYVHTCSEEQIGSYFVLPDPNGIHKVKYAKGWQKNDQSDLLDYQRQPMEELEAKERHHNFDEIVQGFGQYEALVEASRCVDCGMCHDACPTHMHAPEYIHAIARGDNEEAVRQIYRTNPFAHTCGRVCTHKCEDACSIGHRGEPLAIRWLKRYAMDQVEHGRIKDIIRDDLKPAGSDKKVAIIGAGPAGLTAAFDLVKQGHQVVVFEASAQAGGMTRYGIPEYRLPYSRLDDDIDIITSLGVEIRYNTRVGQDVQITDLQQQFDAVLLAIGIQQGRSARLPGSDHPQVQPAISVLRQISEQENFTVPRMPVILGGGNVSMDIARSLIRLQRQHNLPPHVTILYHSAIDTMPADREEIREADEEDVIIINPYGPRELVFENDRLQAIKVMQVTATHDAQGRRNMQFDETDERLLECDLYIEAIGQTADISLLPEALIEQLEWERGRLTVDADGHTSLPWLWAAGDVVNGPDVVHAVADGHKAASSIHHYLQTREIHHEPA